MITLGVDMEEAKPLKLSGCTFWIRPLTKRKRRELRMGIGLSAYPQPGETLSDTKAAEWERVTLDWAIERWDGPVDGDGSPVECTTESRRALMDEVEPVAERIMAESENGWMRAISPDEEEEKNSSCSASGSDAQGTSQDSAEEKTAAAASA